MLLTVSVMQAGCHDVSCKTKLVFPVSKAPRLVQLYNCIFFLNVSARARTVFVLKTHVSLDSDALQAYAHGATGVTIIEIMPPY